MRVPFEYELISEVVAIDTSRYDNQQSVETKMFFGNGLLRIVTWNVNGLRAALRKGFADAVEQLKPDVLMLQEIRTLPEQLPTDWQQPKGWNVWWNPAERKGYSGTAIFSQIPMRKLPLRGLPKNNEGRVQRVEIDDLQIVNM